MKDKKRINIGLCIMVILISTPLALYFSTFHNGLSPNSQEWSAFGSYLSGSYSFLFGIFTILILLETVKETRKANEKQSEQFKIQLEKSHSESTLNDVILLTKMIDEIIDRNPTITNRNSVTSYFTSELIRRSKAKPVSDEEDLWNLAIEFMRSDRARFQGEVHVLAELIKRVNSIEDEDLSATAKAIVKGLITDPYRFWLECYARVWNLEAKRGLEKWHDFSSIPIEIEFLIPDPPDYPEEI